MTRDQARSALAAYLSETADPDDEVDPDEYANDVVGSLADDDDSEVAQAVRVLTDLDSE